jgi:cyclic-di-GMP phosphodiesterase TipF (flagellum assembly factor)
MADDDLVNKNISLDKKGGLRARLSLFDRPLASGEAAKELSLYDYFNDHLTFKNIVIGLCLATFLIFVASAVSLQMAFLTAALMGLLGVMLLEMSSRRKWEHSLLDQIRRMNGEYERIARDVARNRNDTGSLRKELANAAGTLVRSYDQNPVEAAAVEQRMLRAIAEQLSRLSDIPNEAGQAAAPSAPLPFDQSILAKGIDSADIGKRLTDDQVLQLVNAAVRADRIDMFLQPIVNLPQRKLRFYETFSRIRIMPEIYLPATRYIEIAMQQELIPVIDNLLLLRGLQAIRNTAEGDYNRAFFFNITSLTLHDPKFMADLVEFISQNRALARQLIFEMGQKDLTTMSADVYSTFDGLSRLGCRFSMDQVRSIAFDFTYLEARHIRFVKIDATTLLSVLKEEDGLLRLKRLKSEMDRSGIDLIVEKIETDGQLLELLDIDIDYGQGYLFGRPTLYEKM